MTRVRVLHVVGNLDLGGGQKLAAAVARSMDRERFEMAVLNLGVPGHHGAALRADGIEVIDAGISGSSSLRELRSAIWGLRTALRVIFRRPRWDVIHTHMFRTALLCALPAKLARSRLMGTAHRIYYRWQPLVERLLAPFNEAIVVDSQAVRAILRERTHIPERRYVVIHNGIDVTELADAPEQSSARAELGLPIESLVIGEVAHLIAHKGQRHLVRAFAALADSYPRAHLLLVGDGPDRLELEDQARDLALQHRIHLTGARADLTTVLSALDVLALPSTFEGFGIVQAEAMYLRKPVVATNNGGSLEVVDDGQTGFLVPFGDEGALTERLSRLLSDDGLRARMGDAGRRRVERLFTSDRMAEGYAALYERRISREPAAEPPAPGAG